MHVIYLYLINLQVFPHFLLPVVLVSFFLLLPMPVIYTINLYHSLQKSPCYNICKIHRNAWMKWGYSQYMCLNNSCYMEVFGYSTRAAS